MRTLCDNFQVGNRYIIRQPGLEVRKGMPVKFTGYDLVSGTPPQCTNGNAKLVKFEELGNRSLHPMWVIDCSKCLYCNPSIDFAESSDFTKLGKTISWEKIYKEEDEEVKK